MSNYCYNRIIIEYKDYEKYLEDYYPYGVTEKSDVPYITFCKFMGNDYSETVDSAWSWTINDLNNGYMDVRFQTRRYYPIKSALKLLSLSPSTSWYMIEENDVCVSRLSNENGEIVEDIFVIDGGYDFFLDCNIGCCECDWLETYKDIDDADNHIWYYLREDAIWYRLNKRDLLDAYDDLFGFYDKTLIWNELMGYHVKPELVMYLHTLNDEYWEVIN